MSMPEEQRPRPQYGEYATPDEQRAHIREPLPEHLIPPPAVGPDRSLEGSADDRRLDGGHRVPGSTWGSAPAAHGSPMPVADARPALSPVHRFITLAMLAFGAVQVVSSAFSFFDYGRLMTQVFETWGVSHEVADQPRSQAWGIALFAIMLVGYGITVWVSLRMIRANRVSWWVPLVGAVATWIILSIVLGVALAGDPAYQALVEILQDPSRAPTPAP